MALESGNWFSNLDSANPPGGDAVSQADNHLRLIKAIIKNHFPNPVTSTGTDTIAVTFSPVWPEYKDSVIAVFKAGGTNTGAATFNANGLGAIAIQAGGTALRAGAITADDMVVGVIRDISGTKTLQLISFNRAPTLTNINITGGQATLTGALVLATGTISLVALNIPVGAAPTSPVNGDIWNSGPIFARAAGSTFQLTAQTTQLLIDLGVAADKITYGTSTSSVAQTTLSSFARTLIDDPNAGTARDTLGLGSMAIRDVTISTSSPSGGVDGDVWLKYTP